MEPKYVYKDGRRLRTGFTTGTCAAAASKAAAVMLITGIEVREIGVRIPDGTVVTLQIADTRLTDRGAACSVIKDGGDDPDVTTGAHICAEVTMRDEPGFIIDGGIGVGRVTKPGLDQPVGNAAINSVPRKMIAEGLSEICRELDFHKGLSVILSVPEGEQIARRTFNESLGITGGISIIGTTGIVEPMSEKALTETIRVTLSQRMAQGGDYALLTPGNYGGDFIQHNLADLTGRAVQTSNYIGDAVASCASLGFRGFLLVGHIGKLVKIAGGMLNTHSKYGDCRMDILAATAGACGLPSRKIKEVLESATTDEGIRIIQEEGLLESVMKRLTSRIMSILQKKAGDEMVCAVMIFSKVYGLLAESENAQDILQRIRNT